MLKERKLGVPKVVEQIQQSSYDRKNKKNNLAEALALSREKEIKEEFIHKITYTENTEQDPKKYQKNETADIAMHHLEP